MATRVDPNLLQEIIEFGAIHPEACYNCGSCTALCPLASDEHPFPRNISRYIQMGLRDRLLSSTDAWLCYYCGDCSATCPRGAEPAETIMAARRWLIAQYDRSGTASRLYRSSKSAIMAILRAALLPLILLLAYHLLTGGRNLNTQGVALNQFAPVMWVWALVLAHFVYLGAHVVGNMRTMASHVLGEDFGWLHVSLRTYLAAVWDFVVHFTTQRMWWSKCEPTRTTERNRWLKHLLLMSGYVTMLILVVPMLWWFQTDKLYPITNPQRWLGYYATVVLVIASVEIIVSRKRKKEQIHRFSHHTDWLFPSFLLVGATTGIAVHILRYAGWAWPTYAAYTVHVMAMLAMLDTEVGIGKWTHLVYRPLAVSLERVKQEAHQLVPGALPAGAD
jgi:ferredoxin